MEFISMRRRSLLIKSKTMKKAYLLSIMLAVFICSVSAQDTTKVLFIGNSITYFNNMPETFEAIANDKGDATSVTVYAPGGTGFINHVNDPNVYDKFQQGIWDFVVLQPGSNESPGYSETKEQTLSRLHILKDSILEYNPCAKILLYEISYGVWGNTSSDLNTYNTTMDLILSNCQFWADSAQIFFAPAGETIRTAWNNDTSTMLWGSTGNIHPNAKGSYLIACSFYASIFQKNTFGTTITNSLSSAEASAYQQLVDTTVLNNLDQWRINTYNQHTDFNYTVNQQDVLFTSTSANIDSLIWDFGDNTTSTIPSINHLYSQSGSFVVSLTTYRESCEETIYKEVNVNTLEINSFDNQRNFKVYPNPFENNLVIETLESCDIDAIEIYNAIGQNLTNLVSIDKTGLMITIDTSRLPQGMYIVQSNAFARYVCKK